VTIFGSRTRKMRAAPQPGCVAGAGRKPLAQTGKARDRETPPLLRFQDRL
jgi:hypothetical protein